MSRIFISYRRDDTAGYAGRLFDRLAEAFGRESVFMDVDTIGGGADFVESIESAVAECDVLLALIGRRWSEPNEMGGRRIDDPQDFVRLELASALGRRVRVVPLLVDGAAMPRAAELPDELSSFSRRNAVELSNQRWESDVDRLIAAIHEAGVEAVAVSPWRRRLGPLPVWLLAAILVAASVGAGWWSLRGRSATEHGLGQLPDQAAFVPERVTIRPAVTVLGFHDTSGRPETAWLAAAIGEALVTQLGAGDEVRMVPSAEASLATRELGWKVGDEPAPELLGALRRRLGATTVVTGSHTVLPGADDPEMRLDVRLWDAVARELSSSEGATGTLGQLFELVERVGGRLRGKLGLDRLEPAAVLAVRASLPAGVQALRFYAEGLAARRRFDDAAALRLLTEAAELDPEHPMILSELSRAQWNLGFTEEARENAAEAARQADGLSPRDRLAIEAFSHETREDWAAAVDAYATLYRSYPDDLDLGIKLAQAQISAERFTEALAHLDDLRELPEPASLDPRIDYAEARAWERQGDFDRLAAAAERAIEGARAVGMLAITAEALLLQAIAHQGSGEPDLALDPLEEAVALFERAGDRRGVARTLELKGHGISQAGLPEGAIRIWRSALDTYRQLGDRYGEARILGAMAISRLQQGRLDEADRLNGEALSIYHDLGAAYDEATALNQFGYALQVRGELDRAREQYTRALALWSGIGARELQAIALSNLGEVHYSQGSLSESRRLHEEALAIGQELDDEYGVAYDTYRLGMVFAVRGDLLVARQWLADALTSQERLEDTLAAAETRLSLAWLDVVEGNTDEAESLARRSEQEARIAGADDLAAKAQVVIGHALLARGDLRAATTACGRASQRATESEDRALAFSATICASRARAASGQPADLSAAADSLEALIGAAEAAGFRAHALEARLLAARLLMAEAPNQAREKEARAAAEARQLGFGLLGYERL